MTNDHTPLLIEAVSRLTTAVEKLDLLLRTEYPKREEIEGKYVSKLENQKVVTKVILLALITVIGCYVFTIGSYSQCLVGNDSPGGICKYVPGYQERIDRRDIVDQELQRLEDQIQVLTKKGVTK